MKFEPKKLKPGFAKRALINSYDLITRNIFFWFSYLMFFGLFSYLLLNIDNIISLFLAIFITPFMYYYGSHITMLSDNNKIKLSDYKNVFIKLIYNYTNYLKNTKFDYIFLFSFMVLITIIYMKVSPDYASFFINKKLEIDPLLYSLKNTIFICLIAVYQVKAFKTFHILLFNFVEEEEKINILLRNAFLLNKGVQLFLIMIPIIYVVLTTINIFLVFALIIINPVILYLLFREIFLDIDKNNKIKETKKTTELNIKLA